MLCSHCNKVIFPSQNANTNVKKISQDASNRLDSLVKQTNMPNEAHETLVKMMNDN
jgi:hypothetical protein